MMKRTAALLTAALMAVCAYAPETTIAQSTEDVTALNVEDALNARTQTLACLFKEAHEDITALTGSRCAYVRGDYFLYINGDGALIRRIEGEDRQIIAGVKAITHVDGDCVYVLLASGDDDKSDTSDANGWDTPAVSEYSAPDTGRELKSPMDWAMVDLNSGECSVLAERITTVPIIMDSAYALDENGSLVRITGNRQAMEVQTLYTPDSLTELRLLLAPGGIICAQYEEGLLTGCCLVDDGGALAAPLWVAGAQFYNGYAICRFDGEDGTGRKGLYVFNEAGETAIDEYAAEDYLVFSDTLCYWHADPEQAYGFRDLMSCDMQCDTLSAQAVAAGEQLRAHLFEFDGRLYMTNYDSELYVLQGGEFEYVMDLTTDYDFDSDIMPDVVLFKTDEGLGALIYVDEGDGFRFAGEVAE